VSKRFALFFQPLFSAVEFYSMVPGGFAEAALLAFQVFPESSIIPNARYQEL
jgi:hypothetical protein